MVIPFLKMCFAAYHILRSALLHIIFNLYFVIVNLLLLCHLGYLRLLSQIKCLYSVYKLLLDIWSIRLLSQIRCLNLVTLTMT